MSPLLRVFRTALQVVLAEAAAIPAVVASLGFDAATTTKVGAVCGGVVVLVSAGWNAVESMTGKTLGAVPAPPRVVTAAGGGPSPAPASGLGVDPPLPPAPVPPRSDIP